MKILSNKGSGYLFVIISVTISLLFMLYGLKKSKQATFVSYNLQGQLQSANAQSACKTYIFHSFKTHPIEKGDFTLKNQQIKFDGAQCSVKILKQNPERLLYYFSTTISSKDSKTTIQNAYQVKGERSRVSRRKKQVKWIMQNIDPDDLDLESY